MGWLLNYACVERDNMKNQSHARTGNGALAMLKINKGPVMIRCVPLNSIRGHRGHVPATSASPLRCTWVKNSR